MISRETIRNYAFIKRITTELKEEPNWIKESSYNLIWEWINDTTFHGSYSSWLEQQKS